MRKILLFLLATTISFQTAKAKQELNDTIPFDKKIEKGKLENGLTYYLRQNGKPKNRISLRLIVKAGSLQETDGQKGLAHFLEHMAFNGTKNFQKHELIDFLEESGIRFGPDLNAYTTFDHTTYMLQIPSDKEGMLEKAIQVLADWANYLTLDSAEIEKEKGVIIEEWRLGLGARDRMFRERVKCLFNQSRYEKRLPIGDIDIIKNFNHDTLRSFYSKWYRPELMGLIVVGDVDMDTVRTLIKTKFSEFENPKEKTENKIYNLGLKQDINICLQTDKEAVYPTVSLYYDDYTNNNVKTVKDYKNEVLHPYLVQRLFTLRYSEIPEKKDSPIINIYGRFIENFYNSPSSLFISGASVKDTLINEALKELIIENKRIQRYGFSNSEIQRAKRSVLKDFKSAFNEKDKTNSSSYIEEYSRNFLNGEPVPGIKNELKYADRFINEISLDEIKQISEKWLIDTSVSIVVEGPDYIKTIVNNKKEIKNLYKKYKKIRVEEYVDTLSKKSLMNYSPERVTGSKVNYNKKKDFYNIELANGIKVKFKKNKFKNDIVRFKAMSLGGTSLYSDSLYYSADYTQKYVSKAGVGGFNNVELKKLLSDKKLSLSYSINENTENFSGHFSPKNSEDFFRLIYLYFNSINKDRNTFENLISKEISIYSNIKSNPQAFFIDSVQRYITKGDIRKERYPKRKALKNIKFDDIIKIYEERVENAADFNFYFSGNIEVDSLLKYLEIYTGNLKTQAKREKYVKHNMHYIKEYDSLTISRGMEPKSIVVILRKKPFDFDNKTRLKAEMLENIVNIKLRERIRENESGTYGIRTSISSNYLPEKYIYSSISFGCDPKNANNLISILKEEIDSLKEFEPKDIYMTKTYQKFIRTREVNLQKNNFWINNFIKSDFYDKQLTNIDKYSKKVKKISPSDIKEIANTVFDEDYFISILFPENK